MLAEAVVSQKAERPRQVDAAHAQRAVTEIAAQHRFHIVVKIAEGLHQVSRRRIARAVLVFRLGHPLVHRHLRVTRQTAHKVTHRQHWRSKARLIDVADHQRTGIDKRIARLAPLELQLHQRIEGLAGGLMTQTLPDILTGMLDRLHQAEHLGNALHGERRVRITGAEQLAIVAVHRNTQLIGRHISQCRDVIGHFPLPDQRADLIKNFIQ